MTISSNGCRSSGWALAAATLMVLACAALAVAEPRTTTPLAVRITSPLGRTGTQGAIRIVAQVQAPPGTALQPVRFYVDNVLLGEDGEGPPFAVEWADENPFEAREISVEVNDGAGHVARDAVLLKPLELVERAEVASVLLEATVQDRVGRFVTGLDAGYFTLSEDGVPQSIDIVRPETLPATYTLLVDSSQSMARRIDFVRDAAATLAGYLRPQDRIIVAPFAKSLGAITGPTDDRATVAGAIHAIESKGGTAILDCLAETATFVTNVGGRHAIVLITDGYDEHSKQDQETVMRAVQQSGASVYVVGIGGVAGISLKGERFLRQIAAATGGRAFFPSREIELQPVQELVASDVQRRYLISYTPKNQKVDGTWRAIALTTSDAALNVRTRPGYFAPKPPPIRPSLEFTMADTDRTLLEVSAEDLAILEDGVEQRVEAFQEALAPVSIVFALDTSGSLKRVVDQVKDAARTFVRSLRPEDHLGMILFSNRAVFAHDLTTNREWSVEAIDGYNADGGTALYDAVHDSLMRLRGISGRRVVVVMTDGRDENNAGNGPGSTRTFDQVLERLKAVDATVFAIGLGTKLDREPLERLARESGGESYFPEDVSTLDADFHRIVETLRRRYIVSYTSTNSTRDGQWRKVEIRSRRGNAVVTSRGGYFAPPK
jgi:Ca-activated chloride channel homolog